MKLKFLMRARRMACAAMLSASLLAPAATALVRAQEEGVPRVIDEVIAQVNADIITLSMLKKEMAEAVNALQQQGMSAQQATDEITKRRPEVIATLVNEQLLVQKGTELGMKEDVESEVNRRMLSVAKEQGIKTLAELERAMEAAGISPASVRATMRNEIMKTWVLGREVDQKIFLSLTDAEVKSYYEANKDKFRKPESLVLSEIFLSTVGKDEKEVRERADKLVAQLRAGADFAATAMVQSEREIDGKRVAPESKGKLGTYAASDITRAEVANALKATKVGGVTNPLPTEGGFIILRVDERTPAGEPVFDDNKVREAITVGRMDKERQLYLEKLRREAYIDIAPGYRDAVLPLLKTEAEKPTVAATTPAAKKDDKKKSENGNKKQ